ncbi:hypothetical protein LY78DRAFT_681852 [Colletotrichum sublineola]|nr:hypothetical protein LY78DRAFT_681852 [Colletotrichum sublineola]
MAPQQKNASKAPKLKAPKGGIQKSKQRAQNKKSASRAAKKTSKRPSVPTTPPSNAGNGQGKWIWTEHPPTKKQTAANGRQKGRSLVQWNRPDTAITLLLNTLYQASIQGHKLSMDAIAHRTHCGASGQSLIQHLARERRRLLKRGRMTPPVAGTRYDPAVRGVILEPTPDNPNAERKISFREVDEETDLEEPEFEEPELEEPRFEEPELEEPEFEKPEFDGPEFENEPQMSQGSKGKQIDRSYSRTYMMASPEIDLQEQHPQQMLRPPQSYQMPWMQPHSSLSAPMGTVNPLDSIQPFGAQALDAPQMFGQDPHRNGLGRNFTLPMPSMPNDIEANAQQHGFHPNYDDTTTGIHGFSRPKLEPPSKIYEHWPEEHHRLFGHYPGDLVPETAPFVINNPSASLFQDTSPPQGMGLSTQPFGEQENGGRTMDDANLWQWAQEQEVNNSGACFGP